MQRVRKTHTYAEKKKFCFTRQHEHIHLIYCSGKKNMDNRQKINHMFMKNFSLTKYDIPQEYW